MSHDVMGPPVGPAAKLTIRVGDREVDPRDEAAVYYAAKEVAQAQLASTPDSEKAALLEAACTIVFQHFISLGNVVYERSLIGILDDQLETLQQKLGEAFGFTSSAESASTSGNDLPVSLVLP